MSQLTQIKWKVGDPALSEYQTVIIYDIKSGISVSDGSIVHTPKKLFPITGEGLAAASFFSYQEDTLRKLDEKFGILDWSALSEYFISQFNHIMELMESMGDSQAIRREVETFVRDVKDKHWEVTHLKVGDIFVFGRRR